MRHLHRSEVGPWERQSPDWRVFDSPAARPIASKGRVFDLLLRRTYHAPIVTSTKLPVAASVPYGEAPLALSVSIMITAL